MIDVCDLPDDKYQLYQARQHAAKAYRAAGFGKFAERVELGLEDECSQMHLASFFLEPAPPVDDGYLAAWNEAQRPRTSRDCR